MRLEGPICTCVEPWVQLLVQRHPENPEEVVVLAAMTIAWD
jgi:hypothetical protein